MNLPLQPLKLFQRNLSPMRLLRRNPKPKQDLSDFWDSELEDDKPAGQAAQEDAEAGRKPPAASLPVTVSAPRAEARKPDPEDDEDEPDDPPPHEGRKERKARKRRFLGLRLPKLKLPRLRRGKSRRPADAEADVEAGEDAGQDEDDAEAGADAPAAAKAGRGARGGKGGKAAKSGRGRRARLARLKRLGPGLALHGSALLVFAGMFVLLRRQLLLSSSMADLDAAVSLLAVVLVLVLGMLFLGTLVSLSSARGRTAPLDVLQRQLDLAAAPLFQKFFASVGPSHKLDRRPYRWWLLQRVGIGTLRFLKPGRQEGWFIYRPGSDGVLYQIERSPYARTTAPGEQLFQIQALHEAVITAFSVLRVVMELRAAHRPLVTVDNGSARAQEFLTGLEAHAARYGLELPTDMGLGDAAKVLALAMASPHYMREELGEQSAHFERGLQAVSAFQLKFEAHAALLCGLVEKLQLLRLANLTARWPLQVAQRFEEVAAALVDPRVTKVKEDLAALHPGIVATHGSAAYIQAVRWLAVPGLGGALLALFALLAGWPLLKLSFNPMLKMAGFAGLYAFGMAALVECAWFLACLVWKRRGVN